jgi:hypothetical protein
LTVLQGLFATDSVDYAPVIKTYLACGEVQST